MLPDTEDTDFWLETVKDIEKAPKKTVQQSVSKSKITIKHREQYASKQEFSTYSKYLEEYNAGGIDASTMRKFKKEEFKVEAVLDLHGLTEDEAFAKVENFIPQCYNQGKRCIIIITGKGLTAHPDDDIFTPKGILRRQVPQWLNTPSLRAMILIFKHPAEKLGGNGALYILLKRNKSL